MKKEKHVIFGAGQIGSQLATLLLAKGHQVNQVRRSAAGQSCPGLTWMQGDATDPGFARQACEGADVVYNCTNPSEYHRWDALLPPLFNGIRDAAGYEGARFVVLDNLYMYETGDRPLTEDTPMNPQSHKGEIRARLRRDLFAAHAAGNVQATSGHASDFYGPGAQNAAIFGPRLFARLAAGKRVEVFGDPALPRSYSYIPDVARGLVTLGADAKALGKPWHLPVADTGSTRDLIERFARALSTQANLRVVPTWMLRAMGVFSPSLGAFVEMLYQWRTPFVIDDSRFRTAFGVGATSLDLAVTDTLATMLPPRTFADLQTAATIAPR